MTRSYNTKEECKAWLREKKNQIDRGFTNNGAKTTLGEYINHWLKFHKPELRPKTIEDYRNIVRIRILPGLGHYKLGSLCLQDIEVFYHNLRSNGVSSRGVRYVHTVLHKCLNVGLIRGMVSYNAAHGAKLPKLEQKEMHILDENQVVQFLIAAHDSKYECLYHLAVTTEMRQGEIRGLKWSDLDWNKGLLRIQRQAQDVYATGTIFTQPKTKSGRRTIQLGEQTLLMFHNQYERQQIEKTIAGDRWQDNDLIFTSSKGTPVSLKSLHLDFQELLNKAGLQRIRFHDLRHTAASLMLNHGVPVIVVSKMLGHSKASFTLDTYGHLVSVMQEEAARIMDEIVTPIPIELAASEI
jgi:integrase